MTAPRDLDRLSAYLDGQLSASEKARLEARLRSEADLREALDGLRRGQTALRGLPAPPPPPAGGGMRAPRPRGPPPRFRRQGRGPAGTGGGGGGRPRAPCRSGWQ